MEGKGGEGRDGEEGEGSEGMEAQWQGWWNTFPPGIRMKPCGILEAS